MAEARALRPRIAITAMMAAATSSCALTHGGPLDADVSADVVEVADAVGCSAEPCDGGIGDRCASYCSLVMRHCIGPNAQYDDSAECVAYCRDVGWPIGVAGELGPNTLECRIQQAELAEGVPTEHCVPAGPTGGVVCGAAIRFRDEPGSAFVPVDRMGLPAIATVLVPEAARSDYSDATPRDDVDLTFAGSQLVTLAAIHEGLDDDLSALGLRPCSMTETRDLPIGPGGVTLPVPLCAAQRVHGDLHVAAFLWPDTLRIDPSRVSGFPNGRRVSDPVIDTTLAILLLDLESPSGCGGAACTSTALVGTNPAANDQDFLADFPYLAAAHTR